jgi:putative IMPACT (imprinted ancient) family translation regulator
VDKAVVIVTRWFGGVLLGSGGLVRAYGGTAAACIKAAPLIEVKPSVERVLSLEFSELARVKARLQSVSDLTVAEERFTESGADLVLRVPEGEVETVSRLVSDLTSGRAELRDD